MVLCKFLLHLNSRHLQYCKELVVCNNHRGFGERGADAGDTGVITEACRAVICPWDQPSSAQDLEDEADLWGALGHGPV